MNEIEKVCCTYIEYKDLILTFGGVLIGGVLTFIYYNKASKELQAKTSKLIKYNEMLLRAMEIARFIKRNVNEEGETIGFIFELKSNLTASSQVSLPTLNVSHSRSELS